MGAIANLHDAASTIDMSKDSITIVDNFRSIRGGRTLDTTGFTDAAIQSGHLVIVETATGIYKPMPVSGAAYASLPTGHTYEGVVISTVPTTDPFVGIMYDGTVNPNTVKYPYTPVLSAVKTALPHLVFKAD